MAKREIVLDTETTGFDPAKGDRLVEVGCLELLNHIPSGRTFHKYIDPERDVPEDAVRVHGLDKAKLTELGAVLFSTVADEFLAFIGEAPLIIHNASFDMKFLNAELARCNRPVLPMDRAIDTVQMARRKFPGAQASLDALCRRFGIDNSHRDKHGALLDSELLAEVYLELIGGKQPALVGLTDPGRTASSRASGGAVAAQPTHRPYLLGRAPRPHPPLRAEEQAAHQAFVAGKVKQALWETLLHREDTETVPQDQA